jgi:hypothetical protein
VHGDDDELVLVEGKDPPRLQLEALPLLGLVEDGEPALVQAELAQRRASQLAFIVHGRIESASGVMVS